jgi:adenine-specific DNA-methyltransferase
MRDVVDGEARTVRPKSIWIDPKYDTAGGSRAVKELFDGENYFDNPKPVEFIKDVLITGSRKDSLILDFFAGSGTTAQAVMDQNALDGGTRQFILVQLPEPTPEESLARAAGYRKISTLTIERIKRAGQKVQESLSGQAVDVGFRAYTLIDTNFAKWRFKSEISASKLEQHVLDLRDSTIGGAETEMLLTEILLKQGYSLSQNIENLEIGGLQFFSVESNLVIAYLDQQIKPSLDQLRLVCQLRPARLIVIEDCFHGDDELKTNLVQECKSANIEFWTA